MKLLLGTHIILWALDDNPKLSSQARALIMDESLVLKSDNFSGMFFKKDACIKYTR